MHKNYWIIIWSSCVKHPSHPLKVPSIWEQKISLLLSFRAVYFCKASTFWTSSAAVITLGLISLESTETYCT